MQSISFIIPVFNRPQEVDELLHSFLLQQGGDYEVIIVEDGSEICCKEVVDNFAGRLPVRYFMIPNGGPGNARNYGAAQAKGEYLIVLDSDCILPPGYLDAVRNELESTHADAFGGPDRASDQFTPVQKAINYSMTSFFTTGGIRGGKKELDKFYPRSFNMGIKRPVYEELGGFSAMRFGEDIDFSIRIYKAGYKVCLFTSAWVYHKRRTDWKKFFRQVYNSGIARINLYKKYPESLKAVHCLPPLFTVIVFFLLLRAVIICPCYLYPLYLLALIIFIDASIRNKSVWIGLLSVIASYIQLIGYGLGFLSAFWNRLILQKPESTAFKRTFYK